MSFAYRWRSLRPIVRKLLLRTEGGMMYSKTLRGLLLEYEGVSVGEFTRGAGLRFGQFPSGTRIGKFSCLGAGLQVLSRNHPVDRISQHPIFFNSMLGWVEADTIAPGGARPMTIGHDVWMGLNVILAPNCKSIGNGAIIGAGSVVTKNVPAYTIVAGNPAKIIRPRFAENVQAVIEASAWWEQPLSHILAHVELFTQDFTEELVPAFSAAFPPGQAPPMGSKSN